MNKERKYYWLIIILLIIIILILLYFSKFGKINNYNRMPTGNVDVFDIDVEFPYDENVLGISENNLDTNGEITKFNYNKELGKVYIDDVNGNYIYQQNLRIFNNAAFQYTNKIAPGISNTYNFTVHNSSKISLKYNIEMYEESEYKVNLKYRLRKNNEYVIGNEETWVVANELNTEFSKLNKSTSDSYSLDWKWFHDDENDTIAGEKMTSEYKLNIRIYFEMVDD